MKALKFFLGAIYVVLIILLLLFGLKNCSQTTPPSPSPLRPDQLDTTVVAPDDTVKEEIIKEAEQIGGSGRLKVTLMWSFKGDIDLHVTEPSGNELFFDNMRNPDSGGYLDVDNTEGGNGACENVYWEHPPKGQYKVSLVYYKKPLMDFDSHECKVVVMQEGCDPQSYTVTMNHEGDVKSVTVINVENP